MTNQTTSNKEAADKLLSAVTKLNKLEDTLKSNFEAFKLIDINALEKVRKNLLAASTELYKSTVK